MARLMPAVLDANTLIQYLEATHARNAETAALLASIDDDFVVCGVTLAEVLVGAHRTDTAEVVLAAVLDTLQATVLDGTGAQWAGAVATIRARAGNRLALADAYCLATAIAHHGYVVTFDAALRAACQGEGVEILPR